jgi:16S rRNA (guanine966-N2)-methyltransferase
MRIIGGEAKGRTLHFPSGSKERPTSDFLREALFNLLGPLQNKTFLDLFAGSGSVGLEAASRGAQGVFFVEKNKQLALLDWRLPNRHCPIQRKDRGMFDSAKDPIN